jgi:hypothetical protein
MRIDNEAASDLQSFFAAEKIICEGVSESELGIKLGVSVGTVKKRVYRGLWKANHYLGINIEEFHGYTEAVINSRKHKKLFSKSFKKLKMNAEEQIEVYNKRKTLELWADDHGIRSRATAKRLLMALKNIRIIMVAA